MIFEKKKIKDKNIFNWLRMKDEFFNILGTKMNFFKV